MSGRAAVVLLCVCMPASVWAQTGGACSCPRERFERFAVSLGGALVGAQPLGDRRASFTENRAPSGGRLTYFDAAMRLESAPLVSARLSFRALGGLWLEGGLAAGPRRLSTSLSNDFENAAARTIRTDLSELQLEGGVRWDVGALTFLRERGVPFLFAGAGHLSQAPVGESSSSLERTGRTYVAGAGVVYRFVSPAQGWLKGAGVRLDGGLAWRTGGFEMEDRRRSAARATLALYAAR